MLFLRSRQLIYRRRKKAGRNFHIRKKCRFQGGQMGALRIRPPKTKSGEKKNMHPHGGILIRGAETSSTLQDKENLQQSYNLHDTNSDLGKRDYQRKSSTIRKGDPRKGGNVVHPLSVYSREAWGKWVGGRQRKRRKNVFKI